MPVRHQCVNVMNSRRHAFTLIELLVVLAIIGILAGLLFPAVNGAIDSARRAQAKNDVVQIATAITAYETEYGRLPLPAKTVVDGDLVRALIGLAGNTNNPRQIVFIEVGQRKPTNAPAGKGGKSGTNDSGNFVDPWGFPYNIAMDGDYNNSITGAGTNSQTLRKKVAVWNVPQGNEGQKKRRAVVSWE